MLQATKARLTQFVGKVALEDIKDPVWRGATLAFGEAEEKKDPRAKKMEIRGAEPHESHDDPNDQEEVISVRMYDEQDRRLGSFHVHKDGSGQAVQSRRGKSRSGDQK